jgi:hypothetical protein
MYYTLKHNDISVAEIKIDSDFRVESLGKIINHDHLPLEIAVKKNITNFDFDNWLGDRAVSEKRLGMSQVLRKLKANSSRDILVNNYALSLLDHYWICPQNKDLKWKDVNFFENDFKEDMGDFLIGDFSQNKFNHVSPEGASAGMLPKKWFIEDGKRYLLKSGTPPYFQEPFNEVIASKIMECLGIVHTSYKLKQIKGKWYCSCQNYLGSSCDNVMALHIDRIKDYGEKENRYDHYIGICRELGISGIKKKIDQMIVIDYLIGNTDRHYGNFGLLRDSITLKYVDALPIYDCGTSLWNLLDKSKIRADDDIPNESFKNSQEANIEFVKDFGLLKLDGLDAIAKEVFDAYPIFDNERKEIICGALQKRAEKLKRKAGF